MSRCISRAGEYADHVLADTGTAVERFVCSRCFVAAEDELFAEVDSLRAKLAAAEKRHNRLRSAVSCAHMDLTGQTVAAADLIAILKADAALAAAEQDEPKSACSTCDGSGAVLMEHQIGVPGSGGWISCPDCRPTPCVPVSQPTERSEQ